MAKNSQEKLDKLFEKYGSQEISSKDVAETLDIKSNVTQRKYRDLHNKKFVKPLEQPDLPGINTVTYDHKEVKKFNEDTQELFKKPERKNKTVLIAGDITGTEYVIKYETSKAILIEKRKVEETFTHVIDGKSITMTKEEHETFLKLVK